MQLVDADPVRHRRRRVHGIHHRERPIVKDALLSLGTPFFRKLLVLQKHPDVRSLMAPSSNRLLT